jgi:hypothetical protein
MSGENLKKRNINETVARILSRLSQIKNLQLNCTGVLVLVTSLFLECIYSESSIAREEKKKAAK